MSIKHLLVELCTCKAKLCRKALTVASAPGRRVVILAITDDNKVRINIKLDKEGAHRLGRWLLEEIEPSVTKRASHADLPWVAVE